VPLPTALDLALANDPFAEAQSLAVADAADKRRTGSHMPAGSRFGAGSINWGNLEALARTFGVAIADRPENLKL
jgi:hypothetical protein